MSNSNEKYIGESLIREEPSKKLKLKIGDKVIKKKHLSDEVYELFNDVDDLQNQIDSLEVAGIALSNDYGDDPHIGISQKKLTESYNEQAAKNAQYDETLDEHTTELENTYRKSETYSKEQLDNMITTPEQEYVSLSTYAELPAEGSADTIYRIANWDGTQVAANCYTEYAWDGTDYVLLAVKSQIGEIFDISAYHANATYADLAAALGTDGVNVPADIRRGGMSIKFVQSSDNKYVQYRLMADEWSTDNEDWQGIDKEPVNDSHNLVESGFVVKKKVGTNLFDGNCEEGYYIDYRDGSKKTSSDLGISSKIYFDGASEVTVTCGSRYSGVAGYNIYNANDEIIHSALGTNGIYTIQNVTGGVYFRYTVNLTITNIKRVAVKGDKLAFFAYNAITGYCGGVNMQSENPPKAVEATKAFAKSVLKSEGQNLYSGELEDIAIKYNTGDYEAGVANLKCTYPIYFGEHTSICCNCSAGNGSGYGFAVYDANNKVVGYGRSVSGNFTVVNKNDYTNAVYVRFTIYTPMQVNKQIQYGTEITEYYDYCPIEGYLNSFLPKSAFITSKVPIKASKNLFNGVFEDGAGIYSSTGNKGTNVAWKGSFYLSDKIYFNGNSSIVCNHCTSPNSGFGWAIYNQLDEQIAHGAYSAAGTSVISNVEGGVYALLTISSTRLLHDPIMIAYGSTLPSYEPYSLLGGYHKITILYAYSETGTDDDTHFYGTDAIKKAIYSINDESANNEYVIKATGNFIATLPSHYETYGGVFAMFWLRRFISLEGVGECVISGTLPDSLAECQADKPAFVKADYAKYQPIFIREGCNISNITMIARNTRYPLHIDGGTNEAAKDVDYIVKNCKCIHQGKHGDAIGTTGGSASGFGLSSGSYYLFDNCTFEALTSGIYLHTNIGYSKKPVIEWKNCKVINKASHTASSISFFTLNNPVGSIIKVTDCVFNKNLKVDYSVDSSSPVCERVDTYSSEDAIIDHSPVATFVPSDKGIGLRIVGGSTVRFDEESSAFDAIVGYSGESAYVDFNKYAFAQQYGYCWRDGDSNMDAMAVGLRNIAASGDYTLGVRLGDCSVTAKVLKVTIDSVEHTVTFNSNYTSSTNAEILAIINTALNGVATADLYPLASQYYPQYDDMGIEVVDDTTPILVGMGLTFTANGVKKASSTDNLDAIALSSGINGSIIRVMYKGEIAYKNAPITLKLGTGVNSNSISIGDKLGISETEAGCFVEVSNPSVIAQAHGALML